MWNIKPGDSIFKHLRMENKSIQHITQVVEEEEAAHL